MKKAQMRSSLISYILMIVGMVALLTIFSAVFSIAQASTKENACRTTVLAADYIEYDSFFTGKIRPIDEVCFTQNEGILRGNREGIKNQIAKLSQRCWFQYAEGKVEGVFNSDNDEQRTCGICYLFSIPSNMNKGTPSSLKLFEEPNERESNLIGMAELYNYLASTPENTGLLYGGGANNYIGDNYEFTFNLESENINKIRRTEVSINPSSLYLQDYTRYLDSQTKTKIIELGNKLLYTKKANLFVVVAQEFDDNKRSSARKLIEQISLNSENKLDSLLIMVDLKGQVVRLHAGADIKRYIPEFQIKGMLEKNFKNFGPFSELNPSIRNLMDDINASFFDEDSNEQILEEIGIAGTYLSYLSNDLNSLILISPLEAGRTYAVAYMADSPPSGWRGWWERHGPSKEDDPLLFGDAVNKRLSNYLVIADVNDLIQEETCSLYETR